MSSATCLKANSLFCEEMLKCVLRESGISWDPKWSRLKETKDLLPDLNVHRGLISQAVHFATKKYRSIITKESTFVWDKVADSNNAEQLLQSFKSVGMRLANVGDGFFIFMGIVNDLCIRFYRSGQQHYIASVLEAVTGTMKEMSVDNPDVLRKKALQFIDEIAKKNTALHG